MNVLKQKKNILICVIKYVQTADVCAETADKFTKAIKQVDMNMLKQQIMCSDLCE